MGLVVLLLLRLVQGQVICRIRQKPYEKQSNNKSSCCPNNTSNSLHPARCSYSACQSLLDPSQTACLPNATHNGNDKFMRRTFAEHILAHSFPLQYIRIAIACCSCTHTLVLALCLQLKCGRQSVACGLIAKSRERSRQRSLEREQEQEQ